mgnify:CR=1 FL=1
MDADRQDSVVQQDCQGRGRVRIKGNNYNVDLAKLVNVVLTKKRWHHLPNSAAMMYLGGADHDHRCAQVKFCGDVSGAHQLCD